MTGSSLPTLTSPKQIACRRCRAQALHSCKTTKPGSVQVVFMKGFHKERRDDFAALKETQAAQAATGAEAAVGRPGEQA